MLLWQGFSCMFQSFPESKGVNPDYQYLSITKNAVKTLQIRIELKLKHNLPRSSTLKDDPDCFGKMSSSIRIWLSFLWPNATANVSTC